MRIVSNGKINLSLNVLGVEGGMHLLDMVLVSVSVADTVSISPRNDNKIVVRTSCDRDIKKITKSSAEALAAELFLRSDSSENTGENNRLCGVNVFVKKGVPKCGGLGGSGTVAAGILRGWACLSNSPLTGLEGQMRAFKWGSDLPALITGGFMRVKGLGERVEKLGNFPTFFLALASGDCGVNTAESYALFDRLTAENPDRFLPHTADNDGLISALKNADFDAIKRCSGNMLYPASRLLNSQVDSTLCLLDKSGARVTGMSGSGATCFGMYPTEGEARRAVEWLGGQGLFAVFAHTVNAG